MTQLETLIQTLCPNGVKSVKLGDCCQILDSQRRPITKSQREAGEYPYYGANGIQDYVADYIFDGVFVLVGEDGSVLTPNGNPVVTWAEGKIWVNNHAHILAGTEIAQLRFLFYVLQTLNISHLVHGNIPKLTKKDLQELQIPLPPLAVQSEIVRILDEFTLYKSELAAELAARLQQYEYYRDQLLTFDDTVKRVKLGEVGKMQYGYPFNASLFTDEKNDKPIIRIRDVVPAHANTYYNGNVDDLENYIIRRGDMLVGMDGYFNMAKWNDDNAYLNQRVCKISTANSKVVLDGFLFHFLKPTFKIIEQNTAGGSVIHLSAKVINNILIPLPPLSEQERIVSILDRFDKLCHDIREGIPAEIDLRQKQYEHYRDKLLTFEAKG